MSSQMIERYEAIVDYSDKCDPQGDLQRWMNDVVAHFDGRVHGCYLEPKHPLELMLGPNACVLRLNEDTNGDGCVIMHKREESVYGWDSIDLTDKRNEVARQAIAVLFKDAYPASYDDNLHITKAIEV